MSYEDKGLRKTFGFPAATISGSDVTFPIKCPAGRKARVVSVDAAITTVIVGSPTVRVGRAAALTRYATLSLGTNAAAGTAVSTEARNRDATTLTELNSDSDETLLVSIGTGTSGVVVVNVTVDFY